MRAIFRPKETIQGNLLADLHDRNVISDQEFAQEKAKVLAS